MWKKAPNTENQPDLSRHFREQTDRHWGTARTIIAQCHVGKNWCITSFFPSRVPASLLHHPADELPTSAAFSLVPMPACDVAHLLAASQAIQYETSYLVP